MEPYLSPGARLPTEVLIHILKFVKSPWHLRGVLRANRYLHFLALSIPELWTDVDFRRGTSWASFCSDRSGNLPVSIRAHIDSRSDFNLLRHLFPRTCHLNIEILDAHMFEEIMLDLAEDLASQLKYLILRWNAGSHDFIRRGSWGTTVTDLEVHGGGIVYPTEFPKLRHVRFIWSNITLRGLHQLQMNSKELETMEVKTRNNTGFWRELLEMMDEGILTTKRVLLPRLRSVKITTTAASASALLEIIPCPSIQLEVMLRGQKEEQPEQTSVVMATSVLERLAEYLREKAGNANLPEGRFSLPHPGSESGGLNCLEFGHPRLEDEDESEPSLYFYCQLVIIRPEPLLDDVKTIQMDISGGTLWHGILRSGLNMNSLSGLSKFVIHKAILEDITRYSGFEKWLVGRKVDGMPLFTLEAHSCDKVMQYLGNRWVSQRLLQGFVFVE
jgi:hypothetical protein